MTAKMEEIESRMHESVDHVKHAAQEKVHQVKATLDVRNAVERRPWTSLGASLAVGFLVGNLRSRSSSDDRTDELSYDADEEVYEAAGYHPYARSLNSSPAEAHQALIPVSTSATPAPIERQERAHTASRAKEKARHYARTVKRKAPGIFDALKSQFGGEIEALKQAALISATNSLRGWLQNSAPSFASAYEDARGHEPQQSHRERGDERRESGHRARESSPRRAQTATSYGSTSMSRAPNGETPS
ncbi:hypothetical protein [Haliangium ochraceum]|nr:hypothetical protein [Haliangium ochraceum]